MVIFCTKLSNVPYLLAILRYVQFSWTLKSTCFLFLGGRNCMKASSKSFIFSSSFIYPLYIWHVYTFSFCATRKKKITKRKKSPPKTDLALLRLPMTARQIRFAQTPLVSVIGKLRIRSSTGRHARNGQCWQSFRVDFIWLLEKRICQEKTLANIGSSTLRQYVVLLYYA